MGIRIKRAAVLGAGVMGQGIAAHLANAGIPSYLFDIAPGELTEAEVAAGLSLEDRKVRNRITEAGIAAMKKSKPARCDLPPAIRETSRSRRPPGRLPRETRGDLPTPSCASSCVREPSYSGATRCSA